MTDDGTDDEPIESAVEPATSGSPTASPAATATAATATATAAWSKLDRTSQLILGGSIAVIAVTILGLPFGVWGSTDFVLIMLVAAIVAAVAAYLGTASASPSTALLPVVELGAGMVIGVLALWNAIEILFDLDQDDRGGVIGWVFTAGLAIAGVAVLVGAVRRNGGSRTVFRSGDTPSRIAITGLGFVLVGWAMNLSGYWVISQAALSLAVLTLAAVIVVVSRQIESPVPAAWAGVVLAVFGLVLGIGQWSDLMRLGRTRLELDFTDYLGLLLATVGIVLIAVGGVMTALDQQAKRPAVPAGDPAAEPAGDAAADDAAVAADEVSPAG